MRLATWNVNSLPARLARVTEWIEQNKPDVLCLQETKVNDDKFPVGEFTKLGYQTAAYGGGGRNGVAIVSRAGLDDVACGFDGEPGFPDPEPRAVIATCGGLRIWSVYVPNGRTLDNPAFQYKMRWFSALHDAVAGAADGLPTAICGDFNVAPTDDDVWDPAEFIGSTHVTPEERAAVSALVDLGLVDVQPRAFKGKPFTYWDYRAGNFHKGFGMRIDLVLLTSAVADKITDAYIDRDARKGKLPSDHAPVVVDFES